MDRLFKRSKTIKSVASTSKDTLRSSDDEDEDLLYQIFNSGYRISLTNAEVYKCIVMLIRQKTRHFKQSLHINPCVTNYVYTNGKSV